MTPGPAVFAGIVSGSGPGDNGGMEPRRGIDDKDLHNPRRANPATVGMVIVLIIGGLVMGSSLALNFFTDHFSVGTFVVGVVLIGIAVAVLVGKAFGSDKQE